MPAWEWTLVAVGALAYLIAEGRAVRWALKRIATSDAAKRNGTLQAAVADEYLKDARSLEVDVRFYGFGVPAGLVLTAFAVADGSIGVAIIGLVAALISFGGVGARAVYGDLRFRSVASFFEDLFNRR
jgi:hypothetical protein